MKSSNAFTLIETIMASAILAIIALGIGSFIFTSMDAWIFTSGRDSAVNKARVSMNRIVAELRQIGSIEVYTASECRFIDIGAQRVDFIRSGNNLLRGGDILATGLASPEGLRFTYLDADGQAAATETSIASIRVWLSLTAGNQRTTLESSARIRIRNL